METSLVPARLTELRERLPDLMLRDQRRLGRRIDGARKMRDRAKAQAVLTELAGDLDAAELRVARRRAGVPVISYPPQLPVSQNKDDLSAAIRDHQVVIVAGETGSGKTTQLPKICLELGRGVRGLIGHTQPRRLAARTVADRIAEEVGTPLGAVVGYKVRFTDRIGDETLVKVMTDGILLAELQQDRLLDQYDTLIIDEAHERSLNIDFILGYLRQILPRRPDLKVIITSATIDPQRFAAHFGGAPVIEVSGRTYPVEVRYRPAYGVDADTGSAAEDSDDLTGDRAVTGVRDQTDAICDAIQELRAEGPGDILVFLSGEREIRDTADALRKMKLSDTEILPLYARLSVAEQHRVFQSHVGRRIVLATNVAETSLTVPGIKYVIDPGTARISRYSHRLKVQRLPIEPISQASANQRTGRCGRVSEGICIRLYAEADFAARPEFTDPEILRTNLASVILQMTALGLGDIAAFPFIDAPDRRNIKDGVELLRELGALHPTEANRLTPLGRKLAQLPVDPRLGRMVLAADDNGCVREVLIIAAALSIQDPRERPADRQQAADALHARFADKESDFLSYLNLWDYLQEQQKALSSGQFRRLCKAEFLHYLRVREWQDLFGQLRQVARGLDITASSTSGRQRADPDILAKPPDPDILAKPRGPEESQRIHVSLLPGLLSQVGLRDTEKQEYVGARNARFMIFPGSALVRKPPRWVMAAELVETSRLWARIVARIEPEWVEPLAEHLVKRNYSEPHWEKKQGAVMASERVTLYGIPIVAARKVNYGRIDPGLSRELFIRHALVEGDWDTRHQFFHDNRSLLDEVEELEHRSRRRDILVDDETLVDFYDQRIPADVVSARHFDSWWKQARRTEPDLLSFEKTMLINTGKGGVSEQDYPDFWPGDVHELRLSYQFEPGAQADGVTVHIPLAALSQVSADELTWQVPGLRKDLVTALIKSLPKPLRRNFVPAPDFAQAVLDRARPGQGRLLDALERELRELGGVAVPRDAWQLDRVPEHLKPTFRVTDEHDRTLAEGKDLEALRRQLRSEVQATLSAAARDVERRGLRDWDLASLPRTLEQQRNGFLVTAYPALADEGDSVAVRMFATEAEQRQAMWLGTRRLLLLTVPSPVKLVNARLTNEAKLALGRNPHGSAANLIDDCVTCAVDQLLIAAGGPAWDAEGFARLRTQVRAGLVDTVVDIVDTVRHIPAAAYAIERRLSGTANPALVPAFADVRAQLSGLVYRGFVTVTGGPRLPDVLRYLRAIELRLDKLPANVARDREWMLKVQQVQREYRELFDRLGGGGPSVGELLRIRWMIEELRISYFAQRLGTPYPVSDARILRAIDQL